MLNLKGVITFGEVHHFGKKTRARAVGQKQMSLINN